MSAGKFRRATSAAFNAPPRAPTISVMAAAMAIGKCVSRHRPPSTTAASPIIEPTERSMPPEMMIGVRASASSPTSTLSRVISNAFDALKKFSPVRLKMPHSIRSATISTHSLFGNKRSRHGATNSGSRIEHCGIAGFIWLSQSEIGKPKSEIYRVPRLKRAPPG